MKYLLDTCVLSELIKPCPNPSVIEWVKNCDETSLFVSVLVIGEIQKGIAKLEESKKKSELQAWLDNELVKRFKDRILNINKKTSSIWGKLQGEVEKKGEIIPVIDALIGATAIEHNLIVVTRNVNDIERIGAKIYNPWK